jgi:hypothetical protein
MILGVMLNGLKSLLILTGPGLANHSMIISIAAFLAALGLLRSDIGAHVGSFGHDGGCVYSDWLVVDTLVTRRFIVL